MKLPARIALVLALSAATLVPAAGVAAAPAPVPAAGSAVAVFTPLSQWAAGYVGNITVRNDSAAALDGWRVEFDLAGTRVTSSYGGVFRRAGDHYTVTNESWNAHLAPGESATFGWVAEGLGTPANCTLNGAGCAGTVADHTPPSRPGPLVFDISSGLTITWAPSADAGGPVRYEVYESGELRRTVTDTRYVYSNGATLPPRIFIFGVRAVDAAGNVSPYSYRTVGRIWRGDEVPPAPAGLRVETAGAGLLRLSWTAPAMPSPFVTPPIAGYAVSVDGQPAGQVGDTSMIIPAPSAGGGSHTLGVRALNAVDNFSSVAQLTYP